MSLTDPDRFLQAILMAAVTSEGLERLVERLVVTDYPDAYRTGSGQDGGVDVLSDLGVPPKRAWQAKNHFDTQIDWVKCRKSLASAMAGPKPPHYTLVFPRKMRKAELKYWREEFHPIELARYADLEILDFEDDLPELIKKDPDLIDEMTGGAIAEYALKRVGQRADDSAMAPGQVPGPAEMAEMAERAGEQDERFAYEVSGREAHAGDIELPEQTVRFQMSHRSSELPSYSVARREGDSISEIRARPRPGVELEAPEPWFAATPEGEAARMLARVTLAKGRPIDLAGEHVGVKMSEVPEQFRARATKDGIARAGALGLGLSEPLAMVLTLTIEGHPLSLVLSMYRVPALADQGIAWGGALGGTAVILDLIPRKASDGDRETGWKVELSIALSMAGESGRDALRGIGFAQAFERSEAFGVECPGLLPEGGIAVDTKADQTSNVEALEAAAMIAAALAALEEHDGVAREMPEEFTIATRLAAQMTYQVLTDGELSVAVEGEIKLPFPAEAAIGRTVSELTDIVIELPPFTSEKTGVKARQQLIGIKPLEIRQEPADLLTVRALAEDGGGQIVLTPVK